jgi:V8-like Glu-specific endopeptidase
MRSDKELPHTTFKDVRDLFRELEREHSQLTRKLELLEAEVSLRASETICGLSDDSQDVELYDGTLGVSVQFVKHFSGPVGQLQWVDNLSQIFSGPNDSPGNVQGVRWGSGSLIGPDLFLSAGHCFERNGGAWIRPTRNGVTIDEAEIATLMKVNFNFQINAATNELRKEDSYPVVRLLEFKQGQLDYALVQVGQNAKGEVPGKKYGTLVVAGQDLTQPGSMLCVIQHPNMQPKKIEAGAMLSNSGGRISYDDIDTLGGSSGSSVLNGNTGEVVGVHTNGGCKDYGGANFGVSVGAIRKFSSIL